MVVEPVAGAQVRIWWLDQDGRPLRRDGQPSKDPELTAGNALAEGQTDADGVVELRTGPAYGLVALMATGGSTRDPWVESQDVGEPGSEVGVIPSHVALRSVLVDFVPGPASRDVVISPLTTLAATLGEHRLAHPSKEDTYPAAMDRAFELLGNHFWGIDLTRPPGTGQSPSGLDPAVEYTLALQSLAALAHRIAQASGISGRSFHTVNLLEALLRDAADDRALLDGMAMDEPIEVGSCPALAGSDSGTCTSGEPACRPICALDANTLRARLASALAFDFLPSVHNQTGLSLADVRVLVEDLQTNIEPELFGDADVARLDGPLPTIELTSSPVNDERRDVITFDQDAVPVHTPGPDAAVNLADDATCPTVGKYIHRLAGVDDNPLRWHVILHDQTSWPSNVEVATLEYRLERRDAVASALGSPASALAAPLGDGCSTDDGKAWLTDEWLTAQPIGSVNDGTLYEVVLSRENVPALAEIEQGTLQIVFRGKDGLDQEVVACRCWNHVLLPAPLEIGDITLATGTGSLQARSLHPGNNLAPLLNGVPPDQAVVLASFQIRNGTDEPTYLGMSLEQPLVHFTKCWQRTNAELQYIETPDPDCILRRDCLSDFPPDRRTAVVVDTGVIEDLVAGWRILDVTAQAAVEVAPCDECDIDAYLVGPRPGAGMPRTYRVELIISNLDALAPRTAAEQPDLYFDSTLAPPYSVPITGIIYEGIFHICIDTRGDTGVRCHESGMYQYYRSLVAAELRMTSPLLLHLAMAPAPQLLLHPLVSSSRTLEAFEWRTHEQSLPPLSPSLTLEFELCPIANASEP